MEMSSFIALDVETANADMASICSIGAARFENGQMVDEWYSLINPQDYFDEMNVSIHGIRQSDVHDAPNYEQASAILNEMLRGAVVITHTHFDRVALSQASKRWGVSIPTCTWLDSARVARRTWEQCSRSGYGLANVCGIIEYQFQHHNALEDAKASGQVLIAAMNKTGIDLEGWLERVSQPIDPAQSSYGPAIQRDGNPDGPLFGEVIAFTGTLAITRAEAADLAASIGCEVASGVTKKTTLLVVGDMDVMRLAGHEKSAKHRKAEALAEQGSSIRIIRETDFRELVAGA